MYKVKCVRCGSVGYSASLKSLCECGKRCQKAPTAETAAIAERDVMNLAGLAIGSIAKLLRK
jgi:hypothetical protein